MAAETREDAGVDVELYTDGACRGNPGPGGWAYILRHPRSGKEIERSGGESHTTNNRMELMAVVQGLEALKRPCRVLLVTDSEYVGKGIRDWLPGWKKNGWRTASGRPVKNRPLWERLDRQLQRHLVTYRPVRGHSGHPENERCDALAVAACEGHAGGEREEG